MMDYLGIHESLKGTGLLPHVLAFVDNFDDWRCDDHINNDYTDILDQI